VLDVEQLVVGYFPFQHIATITEKILLPLSKNSAVRTNNELLPLLT
jgi:hypothetical protein